MNRVELSKHFGMVMFFLTLSCSLVAQSKKELALAYQHQLDSLELVLDASFEKHSRELDSIGSAREIALLEIVNLKSHVDRISAQLEEMTFKFDLKTAENQRLHNELQTLHDSMLLMHKNLNDKSNDVIELYQKIDSMRIAMERLKEELEGCQMNAQQVSAAPGIPIHESIEENRDYLQIILRDIFDDFLFMDASLFNKTLVRDEIVELSDDDRTALILLTDDYLVASYVMSFGNDYGTRIVDLKTLLDVLYDDSPGFYVIGFEPDSVLKIQRSGYGDDDMGRFWQNGTYDLRSRTLSFGEVEYD
jgi:hypothetical protein